jgi:hypothetical protein
MGYKTKKCLKCQKLKSENHRYFFALGTHELTGHFTLDLW